MSVPDCLLIFAPFLIGCPIAAAVDIGLRMHGGAATPTPLADVVLATAGYAVRVVTLAIPTALAAATVIGIRRGRA